MRGADGKETDQTWAERIEANGGTYELPEVQSGYLLDMLHQMGICASGFSGPAPLPAAEIHAWSAMAGVDLLPWEFIALQSASRAYVQQFYSGDEYPPFGEVEYDDAVIEQQLASTLDRLI